MNNRPAFFIKKNEYFIVCELINALCKRMGVEDMPEFLRDLADVVDRFLGDDAAAEG